MFKQINLNTVLIIIATALVLTFQHCKNQELQNEVTNQQRQIMSELAAFEQETYENTRTFNGKVLDQSSLLQALKGELVTLNNRMIANGRKLKDLNSSTSFLTERVENIEIPATFEPPITEEVVNNTPVSDVLDSPTYEIPDDNLYENYLHLPIGSRWSFEDNLLKGSTTLLASGEGSTKYNIKPIQFDVDIYRKGRLFGPDRFSADITSSALPINNASVTIRKMPRPRIVLSAGAGYSATWDGSKVVTGPSISAQIGFPIFTILSK